jgi:hypothetical protein
MVTACKNDDDDDNGGGDIVLDGMYLVGSAAPSASLTADAQFDAGVVEGDGYAATPRDGMYEKWVYLTANEEGFTIKEVAGATNITWGYSGEMTNHGDTTYVFTLADGGNAFTVPNAGLYHVILDVQTTSVHVQRIFNWGLIGEAAVESTDDIDLTEVSLTATTGQWEVTGVEMRAGWYKFRYDGNWTYNFGADQPAFTNIAGDATSMTPGGDNFMIDSETEGIYTITLDYSYSNGFSLTTTKTADVIPSELPDSVYLVGNFGGDWEWNPEGLYAAPQANDVHKTFQYISDATEFKFLLVRNDWDSGSWGTGSEAGTIASGGGNIAAANLEGYDTEGFYEITADLANETVSITKVEFAVVGDATGSWDDDTDLTWNETTHVWEATVSFVDGEYKFRANDGWDINLGGELMNLSYGGGNIATPGTGDFTVTLDLIDKYKFSATVE